MEAAAASRRRPIAVGDDDWTQEDLEVVDECVVCGGRRLTPQYADVPGVAHGAGGRWSHVRCDGCDLLILCPRPREGSLWKAYRSYYTHAAPAEIQGHRTGARRGADWIKAAYLADRYGLGRHSAPRLGRLLSLLPLQRRRLDVAVRALRRRDGARVLDLGCGNGAFLRFARGHGFEACGVETDPVARETARSSGFRVYDSLDAAIRAHPEGFGFVTASHVIEHVYDPVGTVEACSRALQPGGVFWAVTPNAGGLGHRVHTSCWWNLHPPNHLVVFGLRSLEALTAAVARRLSSPGFAFSIGPGLGAVGVNAASLAMRMNAGASWLSVVPMTALRLADEAFDVAGLLRPELSESLILSVSRSDQD